MRRAFWCLTIFLALAVAAPQWDGVFTMGETSARLDVVVAGESPLEIAIPPGAEISGAEYQNGTALFEGNFSYSLGGGGFVSSDGNTFFLTFEQPREFDYSISVLLREGESISSSMPQAEYFSDGKSIGARWNGSSSTGQFSLQRKRPPGGVQIVGRDIPFASAEMFLPGMIFAFLLGYFLAAGLVTAMLQRVRQITAKMSLDEKSITYLLRDGPKEQSQIQKNLNFSKAKLSRTLREMEERKIIEKTPKGKTNLVSLK